MGILTSQKITEYYERFKSIDVTFNKEVIQVSGLVTQQVYLKCGSDIWPCVIFSSSFQGAKIVTNTKTGIIQKLEQVNQMASLRFCFKALEAINPVTFFINTKVTGNSPYGGSTDVVIFNLQFTQRPPDDLIEIMGRILDANMNSKKRRDERIIINPDIIRRLSLASKECATFIQGVPRRCIMRDISFSGARLITLGIQKFVEGKDIAIRIDFEEPRESFNIKGKSAYTEIVEGRKDLLVLTVDFDEALVPMGYKVRLNDYLSQVRAAERGGEKTADDQRQRPPTPVKAPPPPSLSSSSGVKS